VAFFLLPLAPCRCSFVHLLSFPISRMEVVVPKEEFLMFLKVPVIERISVGRFTIRSHSHRPSDDWA